MIVPVSVLGGLSVCVRFGHEALKALKESYLDLLGPFSCVVRISRVL